MTKLIRDILANPAKNARLERDRDLRTLLMCLHDSGPIVTWVYVMPGVGKTSLIDEFARKAEADCASLIRIDCHTVEPTADGIFKALGEVIGSGLVNVEDVAQALARFGDRTVLAFDNYEVFLLADSWLRREFVPALNESARVILVSRSTPTVGWINAVEWKNYFSVLSLDPIAELNADQLIQSCHGEILEADMQGPMEAISVVRRITRPILDALYPSESSDQLYQRFSKLSFVESRRDGLAVYDVIGKTIGIELQASDPERYRRYQQLAWKLLRQQFRQSAQVDLWRYTADVIYLLKNPVIREAFFPSESARFSVETALPSDLKSIIDIAEKHETPDALAAMNLWWTHLQSAFHVIKDASDTIVGFYCLAKPDEINNQWMQADPVCKVWLQHLYQGNRKPPAIFLRRWLSRNDGEAPCAIQAAAWVDIKRTYLELRPQLRRVYLTLRDIAPYGPVATELGFSVLPETALLGGGTYYSAVLDFGPGSVDGWICDLLAAELGMTDDQFLDTATRELILNNSRISLTPLEFGIVSMLAGRPGEAISRYDLLQNVWGHNYEGGSNVVDAVVRGLRKKCEGKSNFLETVRGVGYRLRI